MFYSLITHCIHMYVFAVIDGATLRIDDRLRVAKERREEAERQQGKRVMPVLCEIILAKASSNLFNCM